MAMRTDTLAACAGCGRVIAYRRADSKYCSAACKQAHYRARKEAQAEEDERAREAHRRAVDLAHAMIG
jgi:hypothetical protein